MGWESWIDKGETGIAWGGVCEDFLGKKLDSKEIGDILKTLGATQKSSFHGAARFQLSHGMGIKCP